MTIPATANPAPGNRAHRPGAAPLDPVRAFRLAVQPGPGDAFGIVLDETYVAAGTTLSSPVLRVTPAQVARVMDAVIAAVRQSGHASGALAVERGRPLGIDEPAGVRLALTLFATGPVTRHDRVRALVAGINAMSVEESYYWYAKCAGRDAKRARKALRVLLSDDKPAGD